MPRYADPSRCPDCAAVLPAAPGVCPTCGLPLTGPVAGELLRTLRRADDLVVQLRASVSELATVAATPPPVPAATAAPQETSLPTYPRPYPQDNPQDNPQAYPPPLADTAPRRTGLRAPSVPKILLGLGATCLLVAAVIFLAVAWSAIGIGGRTAVLLAATVATGVLGVRLGRRDLRIAGEALTAVSLGLLVLDLVGAQNAGWLGDLEGSGFVLLVGAVSAAAGTALLAALQRDRRRLIAPQVTVVIGSLVALAAVHDFTRLTTLVLTLEILGCAAVVRAARGHGVPVVVGGMASVAVLGWVVLSVYGLAEIFEFTDQVTLRDLWVQGDGVALLAATFLALVPIAVWPAREAAWQTGLAVWGLMATSVLVIPALDNGATGAASAWLVALVGWTALSFVVRRPGAPAPLTKASVAVLLPLGLAVLVASAILLELLGRAAVNVLGSGLAFDEGAGLRLDALDTRTHPALIVPFTIALLVAARTTLPWRRYVPQVSALALGVAGLATLAQYAVPLWVLVSLLLVLGVAAQADALRRTGMTALAETGAAAVLLGSAAVVALPSAALTAASLGVVLLVAVTLLVLAQAQSRGDLAGLGVPLVVNRVAGAVIPLAWGGLVWSTTEALAAPFTWSAIVIMGAAGLFATAVPRVEIEVATVIAALISAPASIAAASDESVALALHLTVAGVLVTITSLVNRDRRPLVVPGGLLLAAATWVRLADLGVTAPEPYTLPLALVLLGVGLDRIRRDSEVSTVSTLLPGLLLATVPSLLWVLDDPITLRALLLGVACLVLVLIGAQARWSAPLMVGAGVGAVLVVREFAPYAAQTPQWVVIGLAGTVLTVVGVTWEKRLQNVQQATESLGRLR